MRDVSLQKLESDLYRSYSKSSSDVMAKVGNGIRCSTNSDAYAPHVDAAYLQMSVAKLPVQQGVLLRAKYGRSSQDLNELAEYVSTTYGLHIDLAKHIVLIWLGYDTLSLKDYKDLFDKSYPTLVRLARKIYFDLDHVNLLALEGLQQVVCLVGS